MDTPATCTINPISPPAVRIRALAAFIEERTDIPLDMSDQHNCAHKFACIKFGFQESTGQGVAELAWMLQISSEDAAGIFGNTTLNRNQIVGYLKHVASKYDTPIPAVPKGWESVD